MSYIKAGSEFLVNTVTADFQEMPSLTTLSNGGFVVSWHSNNQASASSGMDIYAQVFAADGTKVGSDFLVNTFTPREQSQAVLAALSNGGFVVSWQSTHQVSSTSSRDIYAQAFTANGTKVGGEFLVNTFTTGAQAKPTLTALSDGGFVVSWNSENQVSGSSSYDIYAQVFAADGTKVGSEFLVNTFTNSEQIDPNLTALSDGGFVVSWMSYNQLSGSSHYDIYAQLCAADGTKVGSEFLVNAFTTGAQSSPALTALRGGGFVASWQSNNQANGSSGMDIYAQLFTANGTKVGSEFLVNTFTNNEQSNPTLTTLSDGGFIVSWQSTHQVSSTSARDIYAQAFTANGTKVGSEFLVNTFTPREQAEPTLTALSDGGFVVSWMSQNQVSGSSFLDIYAQRFITTTPRLRLSQSTLSFTEDGAPVALDSGLTVSDSDSTTLAYATVTISTGLVAGEDELLFGNQNGISGSYTNGVLSLNGIASLANYQTALRSVRYRNTNNQNPNTGARTISITVNDGVEDSNTVSLGLSVVAVNDVPIITTSSGSVSFTEKGAAIVIDSGLTVSDVDNAQLTRASIAITVGYVLGEDKLLFTAQNGISGSFNVSSGLLTLTGGSSVANYQAALRSVTYINTSDHPNTQARTISFIVNDGQADSPAANRSINVIAVNNAPVITTSSGSVSFTEQGAAVILDNGLTVSDVDNTQLVNATASISQGFVTQEDELGFTALAGIAGHYDSQQGVLSLTGIANSNDYQTALRSVTYRNRNTVNPNTQPRTVEFVVNDGALTSAAANRTVTVIAVNDAPVIVNNQLTVGQAQTVVLSTSQLSASDDTTPANTLQFTVSNVQHGQFRLMSAAATSFTQQAITEGKVSFVHDGTATAPSYTVIVSDGSLTSSAQAASITFNAAPILVNNQLTIGQAQTVVLTTSQLSASDDNALANALQFTVSDVQRGQFRLMSAAATSFTQQDIIDGKVTFVQDGTATAPSYTVIVNDGSLTSPPQAANITFNAAPVLVNNQLTISQAQTVVLSTSQLSASDDTALASALQFTVSDVQHGQFSLNGMAATSFTQQDITEGKVSFVQDGTATAPSYTVIVSDGDLISSSQAANITFNAAPVLVNNQLTIGQAQTVVLTTSQLSASDDTTPANALQFTVSNVQHGQFRLMGVATTSFTQQNIIDGNVTFVQDGTATAPSYTVSVSDGDLISAPQTASITFNRMPVLSSGNQTISYYSRTAPVIIDSQLSIQDADSPTLTRATVSISQGLVPAEDELSVITPASLSATYEPTTGVLQLTGNATVADYQQTLRQVAYRSQADVPATHSRTISFSVFDGLLASQPVNCLLSVIQVNRAPLLINPRSELAVRVNQPFKLNLADTFRDPDHDELTLGLLPTDGQALPDWLNFDASRQVLTGTARTPGSYNFTLFANDTAHAQARMPMTLVAKVVTNNALILGTALGLGLSGSLVLLCCLGILVTAGALGIGYERKLSQQQALSRRPHRLADLLRKELGLQGVADFTKPTGQAYVNQVNYLITYDEVLFQLYIRCSNDKQLPSLAKELAKLIKLHFKEQKIALQANLLQKETPKMMLSFHQQEAFFTAALNRAGYQDLLAAPIELKEVATQRELNPH